MKDIVSKILYTILTIVLLMCTVIVAYGMIPGFRQVLKPVADSIASKAPAQSEEEAQEAAATEVTQEQSVKINPDEFIFDFSSEDASTVEVEEEPAADEPVIVVHDTTDASTEGSSNNTATTSVKDVANKSDTRDTKPVVINVTDNNINEILLGATIGETGRHTYFNTRYYPYYNMLQARQQILYRQIYANANALNTEFCPIIDAVTPKELYNVYRCVRFDHPELFWLDLSCYKEFDYNGYVVKISLQYYDFDDLEAARQKFEETADALVEGAKDLKTDLEKEKYVHDLLVDKLTYQRGPLDQSAYSAIVEDKTVCAGYTAAMQYLMQKLQIPAYACVGWGGTASSGENHAWNIILIDGEFYNVDCTWDDSDPVNYSFFNVSDKMNSMHTRGWYSKKLPPCNSEKVMLLDTNV